MASLLGDNGMNKWSITTVLQIEKSHAPLLPEPFCHALTFLKLAHPSIFTRNCSKCNNGPSWGQAPLKCKHEAIILGRVEIQQESKKC